ncbi:MAG: hypothetical protein JWO42_1324 [Chloroflexi bacterium]|nr:hypothetical protein [Chloroflexota bacterium]
MVSWSVADGRASYFIGFLTRQVGCEVYVVLRKASGCGPHELHDYEITQAAGPLLEMEQEAIRRNPLDWEVDPAINLRVLMDARTQYTFDPLLIFANGAGSSHEH